MARNRFTELCMRKRAAAIMTPEAMQAATQPPPQGDPNAGMMPPGGAPMDPSMAGGMPPPGGAPMDPSMAGGMPPPPQGDPNAGMMPPGGAPMDPAQMQQMFMQFLQQAMGITVDPQSGQAIDPNGQPVPPQVLDQLFMQFQQQMMGGAQGGDPNAGGMPPPGGAPMDPSMGGMPPQGEDPNAGMMPPEEGAQPDMPPEQDPQALKEDIVNRVQSSIKSELSAQDKKIAAIMDKMDSIKSMLQQILGSDDTRTASDKARDQQLSSMLDNDLAQQANQGKQASADPTPIVDQLSQKKASVQQPAVQQPKKQDARVTLIQRMRGIRG